MTDIAAQIQRSIPESKGRMTEEEILSAARGQLRLSRYWADDELHVNWERAYAYYKGEAPRATTAHDSTAVSTDVSDTIEWMLPAVLKPLIESPDVVRFDPINAEDVEQAALESDYVHHVFMKQCNGFVKLYNHCKDALILKNAIFCTWWDEGFRHQKESYTDLTEEELTDLLHPSDGSQVRLLETRTTEVPLIDVETGVPLQTPLSASPATQTRYDVSVRRFWPRGRAVVENCVPEAFEVDWSHGSILLQDARWCSYAMVKSRADLVALGYDEDKIADISPGASQWWDNEVRHAREDVERSANDLTWGENQTGDPSQDVFEIRRMYMKLDVDRDGIDEDYLIVVGGRDGSVLLDWYEVPENPFSASTPFIAAHKFYGQSLYDKIRKLADHKSKLLRMIEDNIDLTNNPYKEVVRGQATLDDVLVRQVGQIWRVDEPGSVREVPTPQISQQAGELLDYYDKLRSERSGIDPNAQSIMNVMPEESMNHAVERVLSMKEELVGLVIRVFAETGIKDMMLKLRGVLLRNMDQEVVVQLRNKWATINPGNWVERSDTTIQVGLGTGDRFKKQAALSQVFEMQQAAMQGGLMGILVSPERVQHTVSELVRVTGLGDPDDYWLDPKLLADPRNASTPRGQEVQRALQMREMMQQQQQQAEQMKLQMQQQQQEQAERHQQQLLDLQREITMLQEQTKRLDTQSEERVAETKVIADMKQFIEEMRLEWAKLGETQTANADKLLVETEKLNAAKSNGGGEEA